MTPAARYGAAIELLDGFLAGEPAEKLLSNWGRRNRYAGSKDRVAVRDIVFDCLRNLRSYQWAAGFEGGRGLAAGHCLAQSLDPARVFGQSTYAPPELTSDETSHLARIHPEPASAVASDLPDWLEQYFRAALGDGFAPATQALQSRAPVDLRVNTLKTTRSEAQVKLAQEGIQTYPLDLAATALRVSENPRRIAGSAAFAQGLIELQDAASQAVTEYLPLNNTRSILDYCAGGGGKSLALAALARHAEITAYDQSQSRLAPLSDRAKRAGAAIRLLKSDPALDQRTYDLVLVDAPCSGSGSWRRNPEAKWRLTSERLSGLCKVQAEILNNVKHLAGSTGTLAYVTCSLLDEENEHQITGFIQANPDWHAEKQRRFGLADGGDGFFVSVLRRQ